METNLNPAPEAPTAAEPKPEVKEPAAPAKAPDASSVVYFSREQETLEKQLKALKRIHRWGMIRTIACIVVAVAMVVAAYSVGQLLPQVSQLLNELNTLTAELASVDFLALTDQLSQLAVAGTEGINVATEALTETMEGMNSINFEALGESVEGLSSVVDNLKTVTDRLGRIFR